MQKVQIHQIKKSNHQNCSSILSHQKRKGVTQARPLYHSSVHVYVFACTYPHRTAQQKSCFSTSMPRNLAPQQTAPKLSEQQQHRARLLAKGWVVQNLKNIIHATCDVIIRKSTKNTENKNCKLIKHKR